MIDIQIIRDNPELVAQKTANKGIKVDINKIISLDSERLAVLQAVETLRQKRNENSSKMKGGKPDQSVIDEGKILKTELTDKEEQLNKLTQEFETLLKQVPNMHFDDVPIGDESASVEVKQYGNKDIGAKDHLDFATERGWVDFDRGAKVAGAKFYFLKGDLALLENAVVQYAINKVTKKGFTYMTVPHMVNSRTATGTGFAPRSTDQSDEYFIDGEDLSLIATAEMPITGYHADEIIEEKDLPLKYAGLSPCYRKEAGTYGKHTRGLFRVHQFNKLEMYAFTLPEKSEEMHQNILAIEEEIWQEIGIPYHVINIASGDLGAPAAKKYDIEYWSKVDGSYREITSCSNCTDFQTRNLNIRVRRSDGKVELLHSLNGTAVSMARTLVAILEHYQTSDGMLAIPKILQTYMGGREQI
ncbi:MAG: serine--tRNA ligase [bacterium]